eukprot:3150910-Rhodomonas_salina.2
MLKRHTDCAAKVAYCRCFRRAFVRAHARSSTDSALHGTMPVSVVCTVSESQSILYQNWKYNAISSTDSAHLVPEPVVSLTAYDEDPSLFVWDGLSFVPISLGPYPPDTPYNPAAVLSLYAPDMPFLVRCLSIPLRMSGTHIAYAEYLPMPLIRHVRY